ncbi:MAG: FKBP-type peptidyl-prolyl cis-trans isomerase [Bacteroidota bacterium]
MMKKYAMLILPISFCCHSVVLAFQSTQDSIPQSLEEYYRFHNLQPNSGPFGVAYLIDKTGKGRKPQAGDYVVLSYTGRFLNGEVFDQSDANDPFVFQLGYRQVIKGWEAGLPFFNVGSKGRLFIPPAMAYGKRGAGTRIPPNTPLIFEIELLRIMNFEEYDRYMVELEEKERQSYEQHQQKQFTQDKKIIQQYAISNKLRTKRTPSGLSYVITKKGKGPKAKGGDLLSVHYEGHLTDGSTFDSSFGKKPYEFPLARGKVIPGWDEGLTHFSKGSEGWLLIPSKLAYGPRAIEEDDISIPANSVLVFKIKVVDIQPKTIK